jgi:type III restriction enzyme
MPRTTIDRLIINSPYEEPARHWRYERETRTFELVEGRRPATWWPRVTPGRSASDSDKETELSDEIYRHL